MTEPPPVAPAEPGKKLPTPAGRPAGPPESAPQTPPPATPAQTPQTPPPATPAQAPQTPPPATPAQAPETPPPGTAAPAPEARPPETAGSDATAPGAGAPEVETPASAAGAPEADPSVRDPAYAPDPAGTRPKVGPMSLAALGPLGGLPPRGSAGLGQTFRAPGDGPPPVRPLLVPAPAPAPEPGRTHAEVAAESPHTPRFQFIFGALLALGLSAIAITTYTLASGRVASPADWSPWHPTGTGVQAAVEIGNHVASEYRQPGTGQLLAVKGGPLTLAGVPVTIALKTGATANGGVSVLTGNAVLYKMCGLGPGCTITGKASSERLMMVRREALELALYTFQYVGGADQVVVFLPPILQRAPVPGKPNKVKVTTDPTDAVFFRASDLAGELSHPLEATLTQQTPSLATIDRAPDTALVNQLTSPSLYKFSFVQTSQDFSLFLVLQPFGLGN